MFGQRAADGKPSANFGRLGGNSIRRCSRDDRRGEVCERTKYFHQFDPCIFFTQSTVLTRKVRGGMRDNGNLGSFAALHKRLFLGYR